MDTVGTRYTREDKYRLAAGFIEAAAGTVVDVGARDRILQGYLSAGLKYCSADITGHHDFTWDLELPIPSDDRSFDYVVALDVLEHIDHLHEALRELLRIARRSLLITLPNFSCLSYRLSFLSRGTFAGTDKYSLFKTPAEDRHRWLTVYAEIVPYLHQVAREHRCSMHQRNILCGTNTFFDRLARYLPLPAALRTHTVFAVMQKNR